MKKFLGFCFMVLFSNYGYSNSENIFDTQNFSSVSLFAIAGLFLIFSLLIITQHLVFKNKLKKHIIENEKMFSDLRKSQDVKIEKIEIEMLNMMNSTISELQRDYMNKIIKIRTDIEEHRSKIISLKEENKELSEFYHKIIKDHLNPIIENISTN